MVMSCGHGLGSGIQTSPLLAALGAGKRSTPDMLTESVLIKPRYVAQYGSISAIGSGRCGIPVGIGRVVRNIALFQYKVHLCSLESKLVGAEVFSNAFGSLSFGFQWCGPHQN